MIQLEKTNIHETACDQNSHMIDQINDDIKYMLSDIINNNLLCGNSLTLCMQKEITNMCLGVIAQIYDNYNEYTIMNCVISLLNNAESLKTIQSNELEEKRNMKDVLIKKKDEMKEMKEMKHMKKIKEKSKINEVVESMETKKTQDNKEIIVDEKKNSMTNKFKELLEGESSNVDVNQEEYKLVMIKELYSSKKKNLANKNLGENDLDDLNLNNLNNLNDLKKCNLEKIERFRKLPYFEQKSNEWLMQRNNYLTASTISASLGLNGAAARRNLILNKASNGQINNFKGNHATHWGNKYEPVAKEIYSNRNNIEVYEFGMITNEKYPILGVSPDGITELKMLEIKCPYSRLIDGKIKTDYYHQVQDQLCVCEFDECDFLECKFEEIDSNIFWEDFDLTENSENKEKGIIISIITYNKIFGEATIEYLYSPIQYWNQMDKLKEWEKNEIDKISLESNKYYLGHNYWQLKIYSCQTINRDPNWIKVNYPILEKLWKEILYYRECGVEKLLDDKNMNDIKCVTANMQKKSLKPILGQCYL